MASSASDSTNGEAFLAQVAEQNSHDLARANLLRMRGGYDAAVDQCLSVLKRAPEDPDAHTLIGDIYAEQGDLGQAAQWYELALDLNPESAADRQKLAYVQQRIRDREVASAAQQIALPPATPHPWLPWAVMGSVAVIIGIGSFLLGMRQETPPSTGKTTIPVSNPLENSRQDDSNFPADGGSGSLAEEDRRLMSSLSGQVPAGIALLWAYQDPRNRDIVVTLRARPDDSERVIAGEVARGILHLVAGANQVTVRTEKGAQITHIATVDRARLAVTEQAGWSDSHPGGEALADALLSQEWPEHVATPNSTTGSPSDGTPPINASTATTSGATGIETTGSATGSAQTP